MSRGRRERCARSLGIGLAAGSPWVGDFKQLQGAAGRIDCERVGGGEPAVSISEPVQTKYRASSAQGGIGTRIGGPLKRSARIVDVFGGGAGDQARAVSNHEACSSERPLKNEVETSHSEDVGCRNGRRLREGVPSQDREGIGFDELHVRGI